MEVLDLTHPTRFADGNVRAMEQKKKEWSQCLRKKEGGENFFKK